MSYAIILTISSLLLVPGILASLIPGIPNLLYMLLVTLVFGFYDNFVHITGSNIITLIIVAVVAMLIDFISGIIGAKWGGASWKSIIYGLAGLVVGSMFIPVPIFGSVIGMFLGVLFYEYYRTRSVRVANRAAVGSFLGFLAGTSVRVGASILFLILFVVFAAN